MIILSRDAQDKGRQLEGLTQRILESLGYRRVTVRSFSSSGAEIDVTGEYATPLPGGQEMITPLVCECKAHREAQATPDWLKFLGKVYAAEAAHGGQVNGCFIALSGVNGIVHGQYIAYKQHKQNISLLTQAEIETSARGLYGLCTAEERDKAVRSFTRRSIRAFDIAYFEEKLYWVASFEDGTFALLAGHGESLPPEKENEIGGLVTQAAPVGQLVSLAAEYEAQRQKALLQKELIAWLASHDGGVSVVRSDDELHVPIEGREARSPLLISNFAEIVASLEAEGLLVYDVGKQRIELRHDEGGICPAFPGVVDFMLRPPRDEGPTRTFVSSAFYDRHINEQLIARIQKVQGGLPLSDNQKAKLIEILRLTPSGLQLCVRPIEMIVGHRSRDTELPDHVNVADTVILFEGIYDQLLSDFDDPTFSRLFYLNHGIVEIERQQRVVLKTTQTAVYDDSTSVRNRILYIPHEDGDRFLLTMVLPHVAEPWAEEQPAMIGLAEAYAALVAEKQRGGG